jgi:three-Cys-motif partner protein
VQAYQKPAEQAIDDVVAAINPYGLHFAVLDPYGLDLPFSVIEKLAALKRVDLMILLSTGDLQRNFRKDYVDPRHSMLDRFAPNWRQHIHLSGADASRPIKSQTYIQAVKDIPSYAPSGCAPSYLERTRGNSAACSKSPDWHA